MNRVIVAGIASILVLAVIAFAIASADDDGVRTAVQPSPPPAATATPRPATVPSSPVPSPTLPAQRPDQPVAATPGPPPPSPTSVALPPGRHAEPAPIDELDMLILESFPPQYMLQVKAGLPSGCAQRYRHEVLPRQGNVVQVVVLNSLPDGNPICTAIYGMYDVNINLGGNFSSGQSYIVRVNAKEISFTAQ